MSQLVLIADGDADRGKRVAEACAARGLTCTLVHHGAAALETALAEAPQALVCQLELPLIDGGRLAEILDANPRTHGTQVLFLADRDDPIRRADLPGRVLGPPVDPEQVASCVQALARQQAPRPAPAGGEEGGVEGQLAQLPLGDLLELFHVSRKTGVVELTRRAAGRRETGVVALRGGDVVHAAVGDVTGVKAFYRLLGWHRGSFVFRPGASAGTVSVETSTRALLREGHRQLQEWERLSVELPPLDAQVRLRVERSALPNVIHPLTQEVLLVIELHSRVRDVVEQCSYPDYQVLRTLATLVERGIVELRREPEPLRRPMEGARTFSPAHVARLREWVASATRGRAGARDPKLIVLSSGLDATNQLTVRLDALPEVEIEARAAAGGFSATDLIRLGRITVEDDLGIELIHVPVDPALAPFWETAGHGALGTLLLLSGPVREALERVGPAAEVLGRQPRSRLFHLLLVEGDGRVAPEAIRENLDLLEEGSLFLVHLDDEQKATSLLRELFTRVLP